MNATAIKLCKDCKFCEPYPTDIEDARFGLAKCGRSAAIHDVVSGVERRRFCETERALNTGEACGPDGQFFQADDCDIAP